ncbi:MAG: hypothetical protein GY847_25345 [Proteobacteria bacterium]|nr:hypothetical protein [Pseudomonadota bacterium]
METVNVEDQGGAGLQKRAPVLPKDTKEEDIMNSKRVLFSSLIVVFSLAVACGKTSETKSPEEAAPAPQEEAPDCEKIMNGTWIGSTMNMAFETAYDFKAGKTSTRIGPSVKEKSLKMVKCTKDTVVFMSGDKEVTGVIKDDTHITLMKPGGLAVEMTKKSNVFTKFEAPAKPETEDVSSVDGVKSSTTFDNPPNADELKKDLMGYTNSKVWNFDTPSEFKKFKIESKEETENKVVYNIFLAVQSTRMINEGLIREATAKFIYEKIDNKWQRTSISEWKVEQKKQP